MPKFILFGAIALFAIIGTVGIVKKTSNRSKTAAAKVKEMPATPVSVAAKPIAPVQSTPVAPTAPVVAAKPVVQPAPALPAKVETAPTTQVVQTASKEEFPSADRIYQLFTTGPTKLPIVETVSYASSVPWLKGRPAWIADYASHYQTSRHFIARSLNGKSDYFTQKVSSGSKFNVFRPEKNIEFYLLIDVSRCKMGFYYLDLNTQERVLLKTYRVGIGRLDPKSPSGTLTPLGKYSLGSKVAIYKPGVMGLFQEQKTEMIRIFGTRWIPFAQEMEGATASAKGFGIHGAPWIDDQKSGQLIENRECIGAYHSDGCIKLSVEDMEELFSIVITKPTYVVLVKDFREAKLPGVEAGTMQKAGGK